MLYSHLTQYIKGRRPGRGRYCDNHRRAGSARLPATWLTAPRRFCQAFEMIRLATGKQQEPRYLSQFITTHARVTLINSFAISKHPQMIFGISMRVHVAKLNLIGKLGVFLFVFPISIATYITSRPSIGTSWLRSLGKTGCITAAPLPSRSFLTIIITTSLIGLVMIFLGREFVATEENDGSR
jgi:hypothetical protein